MKKNPIQFAVVREDCRIEENLIKRQHLQKILMIASGGCTALHLLAKFPNISLTIFDPNQSQLNLIQRKIALLNAHQSREQILSQFNVENSDANGLNQCGNFESLFRNLRFFINEMVAESALWEEFFRGECSEEFLPFIFTNPYWKVGFQLFFSDAYLTTMFGSEAVQHAMPQSYPLYFQKVFEQGLQSTEAANNYFLHHVFLGKYLQHSIPEYLNHSFTRVQIEYIHGFLDGVVSLHNYQMINLSNILDWMSQEEAKAVLLRIKKEMPIGSFILWRQLNNTTNYKDHLKLEYQFDSELEQQAIHEDRSLFYTKICIGKKIHEFS